MSLTRNLSDEAKNFNEKELVYISDSILSLYTSSKSINEKLSKLLHITEKFLNEKAIFLGVPESTSLLRQLIETNLFASEEKLEESFKKELETWQLKHDQLSNTLTKVNQLVFESQRPGIMRSLAQGVATDRVWGEEQDIRIALKEAETYPDKITTTGTYILPPKMLVPDPNTATEEEKRDPSQYIRTDIQAVLKVLNEKKIAGIVTILIPVNCSQGHWELFEVTFDQMKIEGSPSLYDPLKNTNISNSSGYKILETLIKDLTKDNDRTVSISNGVQENGYSCMDYVIQAALINKYKSSPPTALQPIIDAKNPEVLRAAITHVIIENHIRRSNLLDNSNNEKNKEEKKPIEIIATSSEVKELIKKVYAIENDSQITEKLLETHPNQEKLEEELFNTLSKHPNKKLQEKFDEFMAKYLSRQKDSNPATLHAARQHALRELTRALGFFKPAESKPTPLIPNSDDKKNTPSRP